MSGNEWSQPALSGECPVCSMKKDENGKFPVPINAFTNAMLKNGKC